MDSNSSRASVGDKNMEELGSCASEVSEVMATKVKRFHEAIRKRKGNRTEILPQGEEIKSIIKDLLSISKENID